MRKKKELIAGIGHKVKSIHNPGTLTCARQRVLEVVSDVHDRVDG
jgi:hypothetical protein